MKKARHLFVGPWKLATRRVCTGCTHCQRCGKEFGLDEKYWRREIQTSCMRGDDKVEYVCREGKRGKCKKLRLAVSPSPIMTRQTIRGLAAQFKNSRAHTYASENADHYRGFDSGMLRASEALDALADSMEARLPHDGIVLVSKELVRREFIGEKS